MTQTEVLPLHVYLELSADKYPEKDAVIQATRRVTYRALKRDVDCFAAGILKADADFSGSRACLVMNNSPEYVISYFGVLKAGGVAVPLGDKLTPREIKSILEDCSPATILLKESVYHALADLLMEMPFIRTIILTDADDIWQRENAMETTGVDEAKRRGIRRMKEVIESGRSWDSPYPDVLPENLAMIIYTSGTTGKPKGVMLTHRNLSSNALSIVEYLALGSDDRMMVVLPFYYSYGNSLLTTHIVAGGSLILENSFLYPNTVLEKMIEERATGFAGVPSSFAILLGKSSLRKYRFPHLRYVTQAGGAMPPRHALELKEYLPGSKIFVMYGQTEASARLSYLDPKDLERKAGSIGKAIPGVRLTIRKPDGAAAAAGEVGEIVAEGPNVMSGYWRRTEETRIAIREDGLHTGDLAKTDEEGYLYIVGRRSDIIKSGAHRISAKEIEEVILEIPEVHEVAVVGQKDKMLGEAIKACIVLRKNVKCVRQDILSYCKSNLPPHKIPRIVVFYGDLPKTGTGKIRKQELTDNEEEP